MSHKMNIVSVTVYANGAGSTSAPRIGRDEDAYIDVGLYPNQVTLCLDRDAVECLSRRCEAALLELEARRQESLNVQPVDASDAKLPQAEDEDIEIIPS